MKPYEIPLSPSKSQSPPTLIQVDFQLPGAPLEVLILEKARGPKIMIWWDFNDDSIMISWSFCGISW